MKSISLILIAILIPVSGAWAGFIPKPDETLPYGESICGLTPRSPKIDGELSDWKYAVFVAFDSERELFRGKGSWKGPDDLTVIWSTMWDKDDFYFAAAVRDDKFKPSNNPAQPWLGDCIFLYFDASNTKAGKPDNKINLALINGKPVVSDWSGRGVDMTSAELAIAPEKELGPAGMIYEARIPMKLIQNIKAEEGYSFGFTPGYEEGTNDPEGRGLIFMDWNGVDPDVAANLGKLTLGGKLAVTPLTSLPMLWGKLKLR
ncbi:hypothetical protein J7M22_00180 [Candidatus Poribacteria bacterium]|nr:hypothetical protein [Candidatus Poribacteria bacterium]